ncbi:MAG: PAS domain-containing sensor histidine kinase [Candidatus Hodarchaeales archaeon]|jgi:PAS domain S-box-containing protein
MEPFFELNGDFFEYFLSNHKDAIYVQNRVTKEICWANLKFYELHSIRIQEDVPKRIESDILKEGELLAASLKNKESRSVDLEINNSDENLFIRLTINLFKEEYILGVISDITEFFSLHQTLETTEDRLENILQLINVGLAFIDIEGYIFLSNKAFAKMLGYHSTNNLISQPFTELIISEMKPEIISYLTNLNQEKNLLFQVQIQCADNNLKEILLSLGSLLSADGERWGSIVILSDISEQVEFEKFRNKFIEITTHELRTPLTIIKGSNELISEYYSLENDLVKELLKTITRNVDRLQKLIESVKDVGKIERGIFEIEKERIPFQKFEKNMKQDLRAWQHTDRVIYSFTQQLPSNNGNNMIYVDSDKLSQAIFNILENACKYSSDDVNLKVMWKTTGLSIIVLDFGEGIPEGIKESSLTAFSSEMTHKSTGGLGLGLFIVKHIVDQHQGSLKFSSNDGNGTKAEIFIPHN